MISSSIRAAFVGVFLCALPAAAFDISFEGFTPENSGAFFDLQFEGTVFIDLGEPIQFVGDRRGFFFIPVGTFTVDLGPLGVSEPIAAVRFLSFDPIGPTELAIETVVPIGGDLERISLSLISQDGSDPFSAGLLAEALLALANGCCSASLVLQPLAGPPIVATVESLEAVPEPSVSSSLVVGALALFLSGLAGRTPNKRSCSVVKSQACQQSFRERWRRSCREEPAR